jgi:hypothetical protein
MNLYYIAPRTPAPKSSLNDHKTAVSRHSADPTAKHHKSNLELVSCGNSSRSAGGAAWACTVHNVCTCASHKYINYL